MKIPRVVLVVCLVLFSCNREWDNPYDSQGTVEPTAPAGLNAVALSDTSIEVTWQDGPNEVDYRIERRMDGGPLQEIGGVSQNDTCFVDEGLQPGHRYRYRVTAVAANGKQAYADVECEDVFPAPSELVLTQISDSEIRLEWEDHSIFERGFRIERKEEGGGFVPVDSVGADVTTYVDQGLSPGTAYMYRVDAFTSTNTSAWVLGSIVLRKWITIAVDLPGGATMEMVWMPPGTFVMGSSLTEWGSGALPHQHEVTISQGFYLGKYEITQAQWESVMSTRPWAAQVFVRENPSHPAVYISWSDVQGFIAKLNEAEGSEVYRLPTDAEWEYACRAGTTTQWSFGDDESRVGEYAWYDVNAWNVGEQYAHEVGTKLPNPWGLYDMHGNVYEWVQDWHGLYSGGAQTDPMGPATGSARVIRGGAFYSDGRGARSAYRSSGSPDDRYCYVGARLVRRGQ